MFSVMLRIQLVFNRWFERAILEDRYRYLARRGGFEARFDEKLKRFRAEKKYGAVRLAYADARYDHAAAKGHSIAAGSAGSPRVER